MLKQGQEIIESLTDFSGGITGDPRSERTNVVRMITGFEALRYKHRIIPFRDTESGDSSAATNQIQNFCIANKGSNTYSLFGLGLSSAKAKVFYKDLTTGSPNDLDDATWAEKANNVSAAGTTNLNLFVYYAKTGLIYGAKSGTTIWANDPTGSAAFDDAQRALSYTNIGQGLVHNNDILYIPYDNKLASNNNGSWTNAALTLRSDFVNNSICAVGNLIANGCAPISGHGNSRIFTWDGNATSWIDEIDAGDGNLKVLEEVDGALISISISGADQAHFNERIIFRQLIGTKMEKVLVIESDDATSQQLVITKQKIDNRVYFLMKAKINGVVREGLWSFGRENPTQPFSLVHEMTPNNDTAISGGALKGFFIVGDYRFIGSTDSGSTFQMLKTNDSDSYTNTSIFETKIYNGGDSSIEKQLETVSITTEPIPTTGTPSVVVKYAKDEIIGTNSWTTIFTDTTDDSLSQSQLDQLPKYKEIQFRIESTGGKNVITGLHHKSRVLSTR